MKDRELLELAAFAAGLVYNGYTSTETNLILWGGSEWSPLTDDGDALRLAVKLGMTIAPFPVGCRVRFKNHILDTCEVEVSGGDTYAATRRAIARAAGEIGKSMKGEQYEK